MKQKFVWLLVLFVSATGLSGCYVYSSLQSARMLEKGEYEVTPSYSSLSFSDEGESEKATNQYGVQIAFGMGHNMDLRFRYERLECVGEDAGLDFGGYNFAALEPKFGIVADRVAFSVPIGLFYGKQIREGDAWQVHPTLHLTYPAMKYLEANGSFRTLIFLDGDSDTLVGFNLGLGLGRDLKKLAFRPEIGYLYNPGDDGHYFHWSVGLSAAFK